MRRSIRRLREHWGKVRALKGLVLFDLRYLMSISVGMSLGNREASEEDRLL